MDVYSILKLLHILCAIIWVGGGFALVLLGIIADSRKDAADVLRIVKDVAFLATRLFIPTSLATLVFGAITAFIGNDFGQLWVWIGLAGFATTFLTGALVLGPTSEKIVKLEREGRLAEAGAAAKGLLKTAKFDYVALFVTIADMVLKPSTNDVVLLVVMAVVVAAGVYFFLGDLVRKPRAA